MAVLRSSSAWAVLSGLFLVLLGVKLILDPGYIPWWLVFAPIWVPGGIGLSIAVVMSMTGHGGSPRV